MKARKTLSALTRIIAIAALVAVIGGCAAGGDSPQDLVRKFFSDINSQSYSSIPSYLDSSASSYNTAATANYWQTEFPTAGISYEIDSLSGNGPVTAVVSNAANSTTATYTFTFSGSEGNMFNPSDYKIKTIYEGSNPIFE